MATQEQLDQFNSLIAGGDPQAAANLARSLGYDDQTIANYVGSQDYGISANDASQWLQNNPSGALGTTSAPAPTTETVNTAFSGLRSPNVVSAEAVNNTLRPSAPTLQTAAPERYTSRAAYGSAPIGPITDDQIALFNRYMDTGDFISAYALADDYGVAGQNLSGYVSNNFRNITPDVASRYVGAAGTLANLAKTDYNAALEKAKSMPGWTPEYARDYLTRMGFSPQATTPTAPTTPSTPNTPQTGGLGSSPAVTTQQGFRDALVAGRNQNSVQELGNMMSGLRNQFISGQTPALGGVTTAYQRDVRPSTNTPSTWTVNQRAAS